jgi:LemA protein
MRLRVIALLLLATSMLSGCGYNRLQQLDEGVKASWSEVVNQYQRRSDLIPNLVNVVKGAAIQEQQVLIGVTEARAKASSIQLTPELINDPEAFAKFQAAQGELTQALKSLFAITEAYPDLKSNENFRDLQAQIEGTENRITVARNRYIQSVQEFNTTVRQFPTNLTAKVFDFDVKPNFTVANEAEISTAPRVDFGTGVAPQAQQGMQQQPGAAAPANAPPPATGPERADTPPAR